MLRNVVYINAVTRCARMANIVIKADYYCLHNHHQCQTLIVSLSKQTSSHWYVQCCHPQSSLQCWTMFFWENSDVFTSPLRPPTLFQTDAFTPHSPHTPPSPLSTNSCYSRLQCQLTTQEETTWYEDMRTWCREVWFEISRSGKGQFGKGHLFYYIFCYKQL